ncbi:MAG: 16S rRNA (cytidine(1402)-2'-O)-methyltransferase [Defluviitaleaceae bacterium]|nr:16S rRNA (cytidine(1402)-2'-O)-methyltransferase [Defluviitaleaceae bacterium]
MPLYIVATPIGNLEDMTPRAVRILREVSMIAAEDTRHSRGLLTYFEIKTPMFSCHKFNEEKRGNFFLNALREGKSIALISDAGTPCISDPGHILTKMVADAGFEVVPICGVSAVVAALSVSGFDSSRFLFIGFLPRGKAVEKCLEDTLSNEGILVFYESPKRIKTTLKMISTGFPTAQICLCNDISKKFERVYRGTAEEILEQLSQNPNGEKGEYTCVIHYKAPPIDDVAEENVSSIESQLVDIMVKEENNLKDAAKVLHEKNSKLSKKEIYSAMLKLKNMFGEYE